MLDGSGFRLKQSCIAGGQTSKSVHCKGDSALASPKLASPNVVKKLTYFNAHLNGIWTETDILELNLPEPCRLEDFLVLIQHLYSSQYAPVARLYSPGQNNNFHELLERILECAMGLSCDQFGNFVIRCSSLTEREPLEARVRHHKSKQKAIEKAWSFAKDCIDSDIDEDEFKEELVTLVHGFMKVMRARTPTWSSNCALPTLWGG